MNWQDGADQNADSAYAPPRVNQLKLDPGGNYVTPAWANRGNRDLTGDGGIGVLGSGSVDP